MEYTQIRIQTGTNSSLSHMSYRFSTLPWKREDRTHMFYWQCCMCTMMHKMFSLISEASVIFSKQLWVFGLFGGFIVFYFILFFPLPFTSSMPSSKQITWVCVISTGKCTMFLKDRGLVILVI